MFEPSPHVKVALFERIERHQRNAKRKMMAQRLIAAGLVLGLGGVLLQADEGGPISVSPTPLVRAAMPPPSIDSMGTDHKLVLVESDDPAIGSLEIGMGR